jgi:Ca2+/Na+ antiporter
MQWVAQSSGWTSPGLLLALGAAALYVASRFAADALAARSPAARAGMLAVGHWIPVAAAAGAAACSAPLYVAPQVALGVVLGSSVAAMSLGLGLVTYLSPPASLPPSRRAWPFVMAAAMLTLVAGFSGGLSVNFALMMVVLGLAVLPVWNDGGATDTRQSDTRPSEARPSDAPTAELPTSPAAPREHYIRAGQLLLAAALAIIGGRLAVIGVVQADASSKLLRAGLMATAGLSPLLVLPMLATGANQAQRGRSADAASALIGVVLLNLCVLLPAIVVIWHLRSASPHGGLLAAVAHLRSGEPIPLPLTLWRIDTLLLAVFGFALVPIAMGRWTIGRLESVGLIVSYAIYLGVSAIASLRLG